LYTDKNMNTWLFQSNCYTKETLHDFYSKKNKWLNKSENSFKIDMGKLVNKLKNPTIHNVAVLYRILTDNIDFEFTEEEKHMMSKDNNICTIHKVDISSVHSMDNWLKKSDNYKIIEKTLKD